MNLDRVIAVRNNKTIYRDGDKCIKVFHEGYSKADILNEALNQAKMEESGLSIPKVLEVTNVDGNWAIVFEYVKGKTLDRLMKEEPENKEEYLALLAELQAGVHSRSCELLNRMMDRLSVKISQSELPATVRYDLYYRLQNMPKRDDICHGDFVPSNIIIAEDGTPFILDWSHVTRGNALSDAARTYLLLGLSAGEEDAAKYLELYCEKTGAAERDIRQWIAIVAAAQSVQGNAQERAYLLGQAMNI